MKYVFKLFSMILLIMIGACSQKETENEVVYWGVFFDPTSPGHSITMREYTAYTNENPLSFEFSEDSGPTLYRERLQRYFLQGKNGKPHLAFFTLEQVFAANKTGQILPMNEYIAQTPDATNYAQNLYDVLTVDGNILGMPGGPNVRLLIYRKDIFAKYNLSVPKTWDELIETANFLKDKEGESGFAFTTKSKEVRSFQEFMSFYFTLGDNLFTVDGDTVSYVAQKGHLQQVLQLYYDLFETAIDPNDKGQDWKVVDYGLTGGTIPMATVGPWIYGHLAEDPSKKEVIQNLAVAPIPLPPNGSLGSYMEVAGLVINSATPKELLPQVYEAIRALTSSNIAVASTEIGSPSARKDVKSSTDFARGFEEWLHIGKVLAPINWEVPQLYIVDAVQEVIYKTKTVEEAASDLDNKLRNYAVDQSK